MIDINIDDSTLKKLQRVLDGNAKKLRQQFYIAVNKTAAKTKGLIAKDVSKKIVVPQKIIKKSITIKKAKQVAAMNRTSAVVTQRALNGFPLKMLHAKQNKAGTTYKGKGRKSETRVGAFMGPKPGSVAVKLRGHSFKRIGKERTPIKKQFGPSVIEIFIEAGTHQKAVVFAREQLKKELLERARVLELKKTGVI